MSTAHAIPTELGTEKIGKLLKSYAGPAIIAMVASSLYNIIDSIFIGHGVGSLAISGLAVTFPLMNLSAACGTLVGVGASTILAVLLGQQNYDAANKVLGNIVSLNTIIGALFSVVALIFLDPILYFFGASENTIVYAREYMQVILAGNIITHLYLGLNNALRTSGKPKLAMGLTISTVVLNVILAPLFIFVLDMGIRGAALATVIAQFAALVVLMNSAACLVTLFINQQLKKYGGDLAIGAYGIVNRISFLFVMINMGLNQGMQPIAGYNYGARKYSRVKTVYFKTVQFATIVTTLGFLISILIPVPAVSIFTHDEELIDLAAKGLSVMNLMFPIVGFQMVTTNLFQCLGMVNKAIILSLSRQLLFLIPLLYVLPLFFKQAGVWYTFPVSDLLASIVTLIMLMNLRKKLNMLKDGDDPDILGSRL